VRSARSVSSASLLLNLLFRHGFDNEKTDDRGNDKQDGIKGDRHRVVTLGIERIDVGRRYLCCMARPAVCENVDDVEYLETIGDAEDEIDCDSARQHRQRYIAQLMIEIGAIERGRLIIGIGDRIEASQEDCHDVTHAAPGVH